MQRTTTERLSPAERITTSAAPTSIPGSKPQVREVEAKA